jgi:hypothetical protein
LKVAAGAMMFTGFPHAHAPVGGGDERAYIDRLQEEQIIKTPITPISEPMRDAVGGIRPEYISDTGAGDGFAAACAARKRRHEEKRW